MVAEIVLFEGTYGQRKVIHIEGIYHSIMTLISIVIMSTNYSMTMKISVSRKVSGSQYFPLRNKISNKIVGKTISFGHLTMRSSYSG